MFTHHFSKYGYEHQLFQYHLGGESNGFGFFPRLIPKTFVRRTFVGYDMLTDQQNSS